MKFAKYTFQSVRSLQILGLGGAIKLLVARYIDREFTVSPRGYRMPIRFRGRTSDVAIIYNIIVLREHEVDSGYRAESVIDAGANMGASVVYFANRFPKARIVAIEPEATNFELLERNTRGYENITLIQGAVWPDDVPLKLVNCGADKWAFRFAPAEEAGPETVVGVSMNDLVGEGVDLVKVDIEGGELEVFQQRVEWLAKIDMLLIEIHPGAWESVLGAITKRHFDARIKGGCLQFKFRS